MTLYAGLYYTNMIINFAMLQLGNTQTGLMLDPLAHIRGSK